MEHLRFIVEGRGDAPHSPEQIRQLFREGLITNATRLSRDGKQWLPAVQLLNRLPDEPKPRPPTPVLGVRSIS